MPRQRPRTEQDPRDSRIEEQEREIARLREALTRVESDRDQWKRDRDRWKRRSEHLKQELDAARRAGFRQAAPFAKDRPQGRGGRPGRRAGAHYGRQACRRCPAQVDETRRAPVAAACPDCGGAVELSRVATQYQEDLPVVRPIVRRFDIEVGHCSQCRRRVQGRHRLQTSDALGAASVQLGPDVVALVVRLHTHLGVPLAKVAHLLRTQFGLTVTPGGLAQVLHRTARQAAPTYTALCRQVRESPVVTPDETGWRVGAMRHWLWVFATPRTTVYAIRPGRGFDDAATVLGTDVAGVLVRDGWAPYRRFAAHLDREFAATFAFLWDPSIDATNWRAEQAIRPAVVTRNVCGGHRTRHGADTQQVLASVVRTAYQRQLDLAPLIITMRRSSSPVVPDTLQRSPP